MIAPPLAFAVGLVAAFRDRSAVWTRAGLVASFITFAFWLLWLAAMLSGG
jgi:hypothetical protein